MGNNKNKITNQMLKHLQLLRFEEVSDYKRWCKQNKLSTSLDKNLQQRQKELRLKYGNDSQFNDQEEVNYNQILKSRKFKPANFKAELLNLFEMDKNSLLAYPEGRIKPIAQFIAEKCHSKKNQHKVKGFKKALRKVLVSFVGNRSKKIFRRLQYLYYLVKLAELNKHWRNNPELWEPKSNSIQKNITSLYDFLLIQYSIPSVLRNEMINKIYWDDNVLNWYLHVGNGGNIRTAENLPIALTKKMANYFIQVPICFNIYEAFRWAQARAMGADVHQAKAIVKTSIGESFYDNVFWKSVIQFFINNPSIRSDQYNLVIRYISNQKYDNILVHENGEYVERPAQPNISMKGRCAVKLLELAEEWLSNLKKNGVAQNIEWNKSKYNDLKFAEGNHEDETLWIFKELTSSRELFAEGNSMHHCVYTYEIDCVKGESSIWSLISRKKSGTVKKELTIEIDPSENSIVEALGKYNKSPNKPQLQILHKFADSNNLKVDELN